MRTFIESNEDIRKAHGHMLEGVSHYTGDSKLNQYEQNRMAMLLENAEFEACNKLGWTRQQLREAMTNNAASVAFVKNQLPIIRRVYPNSIARELVSVQPMAQPTTKIFYYDIKRDDASSLADDIHAQRTYADNEEYNPSSPKAIKEINLKITEDSMSATEKKLKAKWTEEAKQDIMAYHGINVEADLNAALATEITREWDRIILESMLTAATGGSATFSQKEPAGISYTDRKVWMEGLYEAMIDVDTSIFKKRYRKTNWVVFPAEVAGFIEKMAGFKADATAVDQKIIASGGRYFMGTLSNRWRCYCDPFFTANKILMGYNNAGDWMDTSAVWSPYILSYFSDTFLDPDTFVNTRAIMSRAGFKVTVPDLLGVVSLVQS